MEYEIIVTVDENDADGQTAINKISKEKLDLIRPLIAAIKKFQPYEAEWCPKKFPGDLKTWTANYPTGECLREDMGEKSIYKIYPAFSKDIFELFEEFCPYCDYGFHTILSVSIYPISEKEVLL